MRRLAVPLCLCPVAALMVACGGGPVAAPATTTNKMAVKTFLVTRPTDPVPFHFTATLDNYFNCEYTDSGETYYSISLRADDETLHGYAPKDSSEGKQLFGILKDGRPHPVDVQLRAVGPSGQQIRSGSDSSAIVKVLGAR